MDDVSTSTSSLTVRFTLSPSFKSRDVSLSPVLISGPCVSIKIETGPILISAFLLINFTYFYEKFHNLLKIRKAIKKIRAQGAKSGPGAENGRITLR